MRIRSQEEGHLEYETVHEDGLGLMVFEIVETHREEGKQLNSDDDEDGIGTGVEEGNGPERGIVQLVQR